MTDAAGARERSAGRIATPLSAAALAAFDAILDARSPAEFAEDHLPGAMSCPVLDDAQRALVGTIYKQSSSFEARRVGAPLVARNIARHMEERFAGMPRTWRPLVYCWRGGTRSGAFVHVLRQVGWNALQLAGGYRAFRKQVVQDLGELPARLTYRVVCGATGTGKSRLLEALGRAGAQVLDLEGLAAHRGSLLGDLPDAPQPSQKAFETALWGALSAFDPGRPVYVESESRKVGNLRVPDALIGRMRESQCLRLEASGEVRIALLLADYAHLIERADVLVAKLECLAPLHGAERIALWKALVAGGNWHGLVADLLESHYDPAYRRSMLRNYSGAGTAMPLRVRSAAPEAFDALARSIVAAKANA
jgi:tRNA 2-selenouridine synthase